MSKSTINCIYMIGCIVNSWIYIGRAVNPRHRRQQHFTALRTGKHYNKFLQRDFNLYSENAFQFTVIESDLAADKLIEREAYWIDFCNSFEHGYNQNQGEFPKDIIVEHAPPVILSWMHPSMRSCITEAIINRELEGSILDWPISDDF